jgi:mannose/fructose/N-acetylgalactosamine-specific phosphotransferase system component IIC
MKNLLNKLFLGGYWRTYNNKIYGMPKVAPYFIIGFFLAGLFQADSLIDIPVLFYTGLVIIAVAVFGFFWTIYGKK